MKMKAITKTNYKRMLEGHKRKFEKSLRMIDEMIKIIDFEMKNNKMGCKQCNGMDMRYNKTENIRYCRICGWKTKLSKQKRV